MRSSRLTIFIILSTAIVAFLAGQRLGRETGLDVQLRKPLLDAGPRLERALTIPDGAERASQLLEVLAELGPGDLKEVDAIFERRMPFIDPITVVLFAEWWTSFDPEAAFEASARWPLNDPNLGLNAVMRAWARRDPVRARLSFEGITQLARRDAALRALAQGWSEYGDEQGLAKYLESLPAGGGRQRAMQVLVSGMVARHGIDATLAFAEALPDDSAERFKLQIFRRVATAVTQVDPMRGAAWALEHSEGPFGDSLLRRVATSWVRTDPEPAMQWLRELPAGKPRDAAMREGYRQWLMEDRSGAIAWLRETGHTPDLDPAFELFASAIGFDDPLEGLDWAARIENLDLRERATVNVARIWMANSPEVAGEWLDSAELPAPWKERIVTEAKRRRAISSARGALQ